MPVALAKFQPHRANGEHRYCASCKADLHSENETELCWQCGRTWTAPTFPSDILSPDLQYALASLMAEPA